jgi:peroxiredoxin
MHASFAKRYALPCLVIADQVDAWRHAFGADDQNEALCSFIVNVDGKIAKIYRDQTNPDFHVKMLASDLEDLGAGNFGFKEGNVAPDITLPPLGQEGDSPFQVKSLHGKSVVLWFTCGPPGFTCSQCRALLAELVQRYPEFQQRDAEVVIVACEGPNAGSLLSTAQLDGLTFPFPVLIDTDLEAAWAFGAVTANRSRTTMAVLNKEGVVVGLRRIVNYRHPAVDDALAMLQAASSEGSAKPNVPK